MNVLKEDSENLSTLVSDLLQLSKIEAKQSIFDINSHSIIGIIEKSIKGFYDKAKNKDVRLYYEAQEDLPKINVDGEKIVWVINNLLSNALKFTNAGDEISIKPFVRDDKMCVEISDTGIGIPEEYEEKIFDRFIQVKGEDSEFRGTGLGLAIARRDSRGTWRRNLVSKQIRCG